MNINPNILDMYQAASWTERLLRDKSGTWMANSANVVVALEYAPELSGIVRWDDFTCRMVLARQPPWEEDANQRAWSDADDTELLIWLQEQGLYVRGVQTVSDAVRMVARRHAFDSLKDYLDGLKWDGVPRLSLWPSRYLGTSDDKLNRAIGRAFLISAVARGLQPGCQVDHVLTLEGRQGSGKSTLVRILGGQWTQEHLPDMHSKDGMAALAGAWFVELSELAAMSRSEVESVKSFISRKVDCYRQAYGRHVVEQPRRCVFVATTNEQTYLRDQTGNRRFWPLQCDELKRDELAQDRDQLFAEAVQAFWSGEAWYLKDNELIAAAAAAQELRIEHDPWTADITNFIQNRESVTTGEIMDMLGITRDRSSGPQAKRIAGLMRRLGYVGRETRTAGKREFRWEFQG
jgi:predicted P-loop ATPase